MLLYKEAKLPSNIIYRIYTDHDQLKLFEPLIALISPNDVRDIWLYSSAGFGCVEYQISCRLDLCGFTAFINKSFSNIEHKAVETPTFDYHRHSVIWQFITEREKNSCDVGACNSKRRRFIEYIMESNKGVPLPPPMYYGRPDWGMIYGE